MKFKTCAKGYRLQHSQYNYESTEISTITWKYVPNIWYSECNIVYFAFTLEYFMMGWKPNARKLYRQERERYFVIWFEGSWLLFQLLLCAAMGKKSVRFLFLIIFSTEMWLCGVIFFHANSLPNATLFAFTGSEIKAISCLGGVLPTKRKRWKIYLSAFDFSLIWLGNWHWMSSVNLKGVLQKMSEPSILVRLG
jgi:hypothetical protein